MQSIHVASSAFTDNDFVVEFENYKNSFALIVVLQDRRKLNWRECRTMSDCVKIGSRGGIMCNATFFQKCAIFRDNYGAKETSGPMLENERLVFLVSPSDRPHKRSNSDFVKYLFVWFDADRDLVFEATNSARAVFRIVLALQGNSCMLTIADCKAMVDVLTMLEPGGRVDLTEFLCHLSVLRENYNFLKLGRDENVVGCLIHASAEKNDNEKIPEPILSALAESERKTTADESKIADNAATAAVAAIVEASAAERSMAHAATRPASAPKQLANLPNVPVAHVPFALGVPDLAPAMQPPPMIPVVASPQSVPHCPYPDMVYKQALQESGQAQVYAGEKLSTREKVAIKVFSGTGNSAGSTFRIELRMLLKMPEHRNVISVLDFFEYPRPALVTRLIEGGGDILQHLRKFGPMEPSLARQIAAELADGVLHLHHCGIVHRDLKSANVLLRASTGSNHLTPVIIDLGLGGALRSRRVKSEPVMKMDELVATFAQTKISEKTRSMKGTPFWMAPEMIAKQEWSEKTDVFAFGIILWEMLSGAVPYSNLRLMHQWDLLARIMTGARPDLHAIAGVPVELRKLVERCWCQEPRDRPTMLQVLDQLRGSNPKAIFQSVDTNGDGALSFMELVGFLNRYAPETAPEEMYPIFHALDLNCSGAISQEEFLRFWQRVDSIGLHSSLKECQRANVISR